EGRVRHRRIGLIDVKKAPQMDSANMQSTDAYRRVRQRLELERETRLNAIGILVILVEPHNHGRAEERAIGNGLAWREWICERIRCVVGICAVFYETRKAETGNGRGACKGEQLGLGSQIVFVGTARIFPNGAAAGRDLTGQQGGRNDPMK